MLQKLNGYKTYIVAALAGAIAAINGAGLDNVADVVQHNAPEAGVVLAAGIALGRAVVALFGKLRTDGVIR